MNATLERALPGHDRRGRMLMGAFALGLMVSPDNLALLGGFAGHFGIYAPLLLVAGACYLCQLCPKLREFVYTFQHVVRKNSGNPQSLWNLARLLFINHSCACRHFSIHRSDGLQRVRIQRSVCLLVSQFRVCLYPAGAVEWPASFWTCRPDQSTDCFCWHGSFRVWSC